MRRQGGEAHDAQALGRPFGRQSRDVRLRCALDVRPHDLGRAKCVAGAVLEAQTAPAQLGVEGHFLLDRPCRSLVLGSQGVRAARRQRGAREEVAHRRAHLVLGGERIGSHQLDEGRRQRPGLVEAQDVDATHRLHRARALDECLAAGQPDDGQCVRDGHHDDQSLWHERDEHRRRSRGLHDVDAVTQVDPDRDGDRRDGHQDAHRPHHARDVLLDRRLVLAKRSRLAGELVGERVAANACGLVRRAAADADAAREHFVSGVLGDAVGLPGEQRLVDLHGAVHDAAVEHQLIPEPDHERVPEHSLVLVYDALLAVAKDRRGRPRQDAQSVEGLLCPRLLVHADDDVHDNEHQRDGRVAIQARARPGCRQ